MIYWMENILELSIASEKQSSKGSIKIEYHHYHQILEWNSANHQFKKSTKPSKSAAYAWTLKIMKSFLHRLILATSSQETCFTTEIFCVKLFCKACFSRCLLRAEVFSEHWRFKTSRKFAAC